MRAFPRLIIWFLIQSFSGQYHSYISIKVLVNFSYPARAMISVQIYLRQSSIRDPPEFSATSASRRRPLVIPFLHDPNPPLRGSTEYCQSQASTPRSAPSVSTLHTGHRYPSSGRRPPDHVTEKLGIEAGLKLPPPLFSHSLG